jgi:hypothetical protein
MNLMTLLFIFSFSFSLALVPAIGNFSEEVAYAGKPQETNSIEYTLNDENTQPSKKGNRNHTPQSEY